MADTRLKERSLFDPEIVRPAVWESFRKLAPRHVIKNPVMFVVEIGSLLTTLIWLRDLIAPTVESQPLWFAPGNNCSQAGQWETRGKDSRLVVAQRRPRRG